jgi:putative ABC transport system permease protein
VMPLGAEMTRGVKPLLVTVSAAVLLLLIIACANVVNLLLARAIRRRPEFVLRIALGAGRARLFRLLLAESALLATLGGLLGLLLAQYGIRALIALSPPELPRVEAIRLDGGVFAFSFLVTTVLALVMGAVPALQTARCHPMELLQGTRMTSVGSWMVRRALVVGEMALAITLLVGSILLFLSVHRLLAVPVGFDTSNLLTLQIQTVGPKWRESGSATRFFEQLMRTVRGVTGVTSVALTSQLPLGGVRDEYGVGFIDQQIAGGSRYNSFRYAVSPSYLETMRLPLRTGRGFSDQDHEDVPRVALISESLARQRFGSIEEAVGKQLQIGGGSTQPYTVVGIVGDVRQVSLTQSQAEAVYTTLRQWQPEERVLTLVVRTRGEPLVLASVIRRAIWSVDSDQPIVRVESMDARLLADAGERRFALIIFGAFAFVALILAAAGCYGVLAGYVAERTREIGVRSALGAARGQIIRQVIGQAMSLVGPGVVLGLTMAFIASTALTTLLYGLTPRDPLAYASAAGLLVIVSVGASGLPAWRAARIDPASTLKTS